mmetsp:Transcript_1307/g.4547  ORF Transcript_1307/g.4547 Transcript_1307/m.4547 type:complete len:545 (+) Transcript_1307:551-2185(+)
MASLQEDMRSADRLNKYFKTLQVTGYGSIDSMDSFLPRSQPSSANNSNNNSSYVSDEDEDALLDEREYQKAAQEFVRRARLNNGSSCGITDVRESMANGSSRAESRAYLTPLKTASKDDKGVSENHSCVLSPGQCGSHCIASTEENSCASDHDLECSKDHALLAFLAARVDSMEGKLRHVLGENEALSSRVKTLEGCFQSALEQLTVSRAQLYRQPEGQRHTSQARLDRSLSSPVTHASFPATPQSPAVIHPQHSATFPVYSEGSTCLSADCTKQVEVPTGSSTSRDFEESVPSTRDIPEPCGASHDHVSENGTTPYDVYLELCQRYGRSFCPEAMLAFVSNTQLLRCTYVSDQDMLPICIALKCNAYIRTVEILGGMGDNGAIHLAEALKHNCNIVHVTISNCNVREMGARALAAWLRASPNAASFCLKGCDIRDCGAEEIADAASGHRRLSTLDLSRNNIGCAGAAALAMALKSNRHLSSLSLEGNHIAKPGGKALVDGLRRSHGILSLNLADNVELEKEQLLMQACRRHLNRNISAMERLC